MTIALTEALGRFVADLRFEEIPATALPVIHTGFADCVGVMVAGRDEPAVQLLHAGLAPGIGNAALLWDRGTAPAPEAAWINGCAAHALDYDDVALRGHPSTVLVPAILAEAQALGIGGRGMATAYAAGYETWAELIRRESDHHHAKGWHPTAIFGAIGAAAACASLRGLDARQATWAIALAASQSAGTMANFGTMTKPFHAGRSAHAGVVAARLAQLGFTAATDALEHPQGFLHAVSPHNRLDLSAPVEAGIIWKLPVDRLSVKKYPLCYCTHRALDGILDLLREVRLAPGDIAEIRVSTSRRNTTVLRNSSPQTGLAAKFSMQFAMASAVVAGDAGLLQLTDAFVQRADVQALMRKVFVDADDRPGDPAKPGWAPWDLVTITTTAGARHESARVVSMRGGADLPLSRELLLQKFRGCLQAGGCNVPAADLFDALTNLPQLRSAAQLPGLSSPAP